ncbi:vWA domain-containing protein [Spirosoma areae]
MQTFLYWLLIMSSAYATARPSQETPQQSLNQYVAFLNQSVDVLANRLKMLQAYQAEVNRYRKKADFLLRLPSSGPLEEYYYQKALAGNGLTEAEKQRLTANAQALWQLLTKLDQTGKSLETYVRLNDYQRDGLKQSDGLIREMQALFSQFSRDKDAFYKQIQRVYRRYQPYLPTDPYLSSEREMDQVLLSQRQLLDTLTYYLNEDLPSDWPVQQVQKSMLADEKLLSGFGKAQSGIEYPASDMVSSFKSALERIQAIKSRAVDDHTFAARQSSRHGNEVYLSLIEQYNQDLLAMHQSFVNYSRTARQLLNYPKFSPVFAVEPPAPTTPKTTRTAPFQDKPLLTFTTKPAAVPASRATFLALNGYIDCINESLRQMHHLQALVRNYQSSAEYYRDPSRNQQRASLTYSHDEYKVPVSEYQLLLTANQHIPVSYRTSINRQAEVLLAMLKEMDGLSIELIAYTVEKQYLQDQLQRSDAILDRYAYLFDTFDQKKEQLYRDVRRIHESYPVADPTSTWHIAGKALLKTLDNDKEVLFGVKGYLKSETAQLPVTTQLEADARMLMLDEYKNLKGLQRYGRSNGLCPYSPYEDLAENSLRFAGKAQTVKPAFLASSSNAYETFYYFYNNELVYQYNKFSELAKVGVLKAINQPDMLTFRRLLPSALPTPMPQKAEPPVREPTTAPEPSKVGGSNISTTGPTTGPVAKVTQQKTLQRDTVFVERTKVDTVYIDRGGQREAPASLSGFATNNMVLLLDVSASMDSPFKMPLLKKSIKSLLKLLRPEDQISIVVYSGKARVVLKPTSGAKADEIARVIDELDSKGDTDGDEGIRLAYKVANKNYIRAGNNRIILATDGEFPVSDDVFQLIGESARQDVYLTVFTFGRNPLTGQNLKKLSQLGKGTFTHVTADNATGQLILEAQAKQVSTK